MISPPFVQKQDNLLAVAVTAERFSQRPSTLLGLLDEAPALDFDMACAYALHEREQAALQPQRNQRSFHETPHVKPPKVTVKKFTDIGENDVLF
jgi:hypothetical protein